MDYRRDAVGTSSTARLASPGLLGEIVEAAAAPLTKARWTFLAVLTVLAVQLAVWGLLGNFAWAPAGWFFRRGDWLELLGPIVIVFMIVSSLREVGNYGRDGVTALTHNQSLDSYVVIGAAVLGPPLAATLASTALFGWGNLPQWDRVSPAWEILFVAVFLAWIAAFPMSIVLASVRGGSAGVLNPVRVLRAIASAGWNYGRTWVACFFLGTCALGLAWWLKGVPVVGRILAFVPVLYFLVASAWSFGMLFYRDSYRWTID